jgi:transcriptional regulator with XRE-family HTH domain
MVNAMVKENNKIETVIPADRKALGVKLFEYRMKRGWNQGRMAQELGIGQGVLSTYERGKRYPAEENLNKIKALFEQIEEPETAVAEVDPEPATEPSIDDLIKLLYDTGRTLSKRGVNVDIKVRVKAETV